MMTEHALSCIIQVRKQIFKNIFNGFVFFFYSGHLWKEMNLNQRLVTFGPKIRVRKKQKIHSIKYSFHFFLEPIPCSMDNWGEGAVPACREERPQKFVFNRFSILSMIIFI